jgi:hypothetical protein
MQGSYDDMALQDAYNQGRQAFKDGYGRESNPFSSMDGYDVRREEWFRGWDDEAELQKTA